MSYKGKIISELSDVAFRWITSVASKLNFGVDELDPAFLKTLKNLDIENPDAFDLYEAGQLYSAIKESAEGASNLSLINPGDFKNLAMTMDHFMSTPAGRTVVNDEVLRKLEEIDFNIPRDRGMPYLSYVKDADGSIQVVGHDGRHFNRALDHLGREKSLVRMIPDKKVEPLLKNVDPEAVLKQEKSFNEIMGHQEVGPPRGSLKDIIKTFLAATPVVASGALSEIPNGVE